MTSTKWFVCPQPNPSATGRLFVFPYAGGSPAAFAKWFIDKTELQLAHYPGRGSRFNEPAARNLDTLVEDSTREIQPLLDKPFAFFGHSMGGLVAFELARSLRRLKLPQPTRLFVSARAAPQFAGQGTPIHALSNDKFLDALKELNGIPTELLNQREAVELLLPVLRADFEAVESHRYEPDGSPLDIPIFVFGGLDDSRVNREGLEGWSAHTTAAFKMHYFPGDHFFIHSSGDAVREAIAAEL